VKRLLLDTNVLISFLTDRNRAQQDRAAKLLESAADGHLELLVHQAVLFELAYVLLNLYDRKPAEVRQILERLLLLPGVGVVDTLSWGEILGLWPKAFPHLADAALAVACRELRCDGIATFDTRFLRQLERAGSPSAW